MTDQLRSKLTQKANEENNGASEYLKLADEAYASGDHKIYKVLTDMATEEDSHKRILENMLKDWR